MRMLSRILAGVGAGVAVAALVAGPALADPPTGKTPRAQDAVGVGSDTTQFLYDQLSHDYNKVTTHLNKLYSWDAVPQGQMITPKAGCSQIVRPTGSSAGISALETSQTITGGTGFCIDYARSSRGRSSTDPACATGGICFIKLAGDAVTWASRSASAGGTNAPATLTLKQLQNIYLCKTTNWSTVGGANAPIHAFLPQTSSGTRAFFLLALGGGTTPLTPGACVSNSNNTLIENEGVAPELNDADAIFPYSVADFIAQVYHSAQCTNGASCGYPNAPTCSPVSPENLFGCDLHGVLTLNEIQGTKPTSPWPLPAPPTPPAVNNKVHISTTFDALFQRTVFTVVRFASTSDDIPAYLEPFFAAAAASTPGWICGSSKGQSDIGAYGFRKLGAACGTPLP